MNLIDRVLKQPEFCEAPPVLVDVGAAGGVPGAWRRIARHAVVVAFEPDAREAAALQDVQREFRRWVYVPALVVGTPAAEGFSRLHLTRSPQCSSVLPPDAAGLRRWAFGSAFDVIATPSLPATTLGAALSMADVQHVDWLKCDTQGTDLRIFRSVNEGQRSNVLLAEFEPGLIDVYTGEDKLSAVLQHMQGEPFLLADFEVQTTPLAIDGEPSTAWLRRLGPAAPGWGNLTYLRDFAKSPALPARRHFLLLWVFATLRGHHIYAHNVAAEAARHWPAPLVAEMQQTSRRAVVWSMLRSLPGWALRSLRRRLA